MLYTKMLYTKKKIKKIQAYHIKSETERASNI